MGRLVGACCGAICGAEQLILPQELAGQGSCAAECAEQRRRCGSIQRHLSTTKIQKLVGQVPETMAGPRERAGLMEQLR